jgi:Holliday junction resolvase-like predicted endonuclease
MVARNHRAPDIKGEIDMVGFDGPVLALVEAKTRSAPKPGKQGGDRPAPEEAINWEKRRNLARVARQFIRSRRLESAPRRFDILATDARLGARRRFVCTKEPSILAITDGRIARQSRRMLLHFFAIVE